MALETLIAGSMEAGRVLQEAAQCPGCIVMSSPNWMTGSMIGMLLFMLMPFAILFGIGGGLLRAHRRAEDDLSDGGQ